MIHPARTVLVGGLTLLGFSLNAALADEPGAKVLAELIQVYKALPAYSDEGQLTNALIVDGQPLKMVSPSKLVFTRPNKLRYESDMVMLVSDGTSLSTVIEPVRKYLKAASPVNFTLEVLSEGPLGAILGGHLLGVPASPVPNLLLSADPSKAIKDAGLTPTVGPEKAVDGLACRTLVLTSNRGYVLTYVINQKTGLLHSVELALPEKDRILDSAPGHTVKVESIRWTAGAVEAKVPDARLFAFQPPAGFTQIARLEDLEKPEDAPDSKLVGGPAPNFSVSTLDGPGKLGRIKRDDLKGHVVLIDFWATWCGPCMKELPEIQKMIEAYARDKKPVKVLAVSLDESEDGELKGPRELVEKTLKEKKITLDGNPVGTIALDPTGTMGRAYGASAIPMVVLLDREGTVQAVHVGYTEREVLEKEIQALLDGKPLAKPAKR